MKQIKKERFFGTEDSRNLIEAEIDVDELEELPAVDEFAGKRLIMGSQCWVIGTGDLYGLTSTGDWVKVNFMGNGEGGGGGGSDGSAYAHSLELTINSQTYVLTATLKNTSGETLGTPQTIDLPLETMVVSGSYDDATKKVILTLKNGNTVDFSVADLVSGLQTEITSTNKLNSDLVNDTNQNNKFVTSAEKTKIANALTKETYNAGKQITTDGKKGEIFNEYSVNKATGNSSHAEGYSTTASASNSHAEGYNTTASGNYSHVQGKYNVQDSNGKYAFIIGNGTDINNRSNAFAIDWEGKIYVGNSSTGVDVSDLLARIIALENKVAALENA